MPKIKHSIFFRVIVWFVCLTFSASLAIPPTYAQGVSDAGLGLPVPGTMVSVSPGFNPAVLKGIKIHPDQPLRFDFIVDTGDTGLGSEELQKESGKLIKYFLASLTVPEKDMWVNLSPYEKSRIIPEKFSATEMGRDLLAQDYLLKQLTVSLL